MQDGWGKPDSADQPVVLIGALLILVGFLLAFEALAVPAFRGNARSQGGAVIIIGPFPIVLGKKQAGRKVDAGSGCTSAGDPYGILPSPVVLAFTELKLGLPGRTCEVCGERTALYVCQNCGSSICPVCRAGWCCRKCAPSQESASPESWRPLKIGPVPLLVVAIIAIMVGFGIVFISSNFSAGSGGCFFWPLPLVVGCGFGPGAASTLAVFSILVLVAVMVAFWFLSLRWDRLSP